MRGQMDIKITGAFHHYARASKNFERWFDCLYSKGETSFETKTSDQYNLEQ